MRLNSKIKKGILSVQLLIVGLLQIHASDSVSLNGEWQIVFDPENVGIDQGWNNTEVFSQLQQQRAITVPAAWELIEQDYEGVAFYKREFTVPEEWEGKVVRLQFGAVNYIAEVWVNDEAIGAHEGGFTPFELRVDRVLKYGAENVIIIRVQGPIILSGKEVDGIRPLETPQWRGGITGGIWQPVKLVATGTVYASDVLLMPDYKTGVVRIGLELDQTGVEREEVDLAIDIVKANDPNEVVAVIRENMQLRPGKNQKTLSATIKDPRSWSPDNPFLYRAELRILHDGEVSQVWRHRFGLREFTIRNDDFYLNGKRLYLKATFFEGLYPNGIASPDNLDMARREIQLAKDAGFNMIRPWRRPADPAWLDLADEMGVLVVGSPALECMRLPLSTPYLPDRVENEIREAVLRDRNRTCIVQWELFNELHRPILKQMMRPMAVMTRGLDPTRLILDESGGWAFGANMYLPFEYEPTKFNDIHNYPGAFVTNDLYDGFLTIGMTDEEKQKFGFSGNTPGRNVVPGLMSFVSELGYGSLPDLPFCNEIFSREGNPLTPAYRYYNRLEQEQKRMLEQAGFASLYEDFSDFCREQQSIHGAANKRMIEAVRSNPRVDGYCIHALCAGDWILGAGLIDIWRNPKGDAYELTRAANQPRIVSIRMFPRNVYADRGATLTVTGINDLDKTEARMELEIVSETGKSVFSKSQKTSWESGISEFFSTSLKTRDMDGSYTIRVKISGSSGNIITENSYKFDVFTDKDLRKPAGKIAVLDMKNSLLPFLRQWDIAAIPFQDDLPVDVPVLVTSVQANNDFQKRRLDNLMKFIERGGTAVYLSPVTARGSHRKHPSIQSEYVPVKGDIAAAKGLWTCIPHLVSDHPVFDGLPVNGPMREIYENVWAPTTILNFEGEPIVASIGFDWFSGEHKMHYSGPGESWWGTDVGIVPSGGGRIILCQMNILPNLDKDPVADKILFNMMRFVTE